MKKRDEFFIHFAALKIGEHKFQYKINSPFLEQIAFPQEFDEVDVEVNLLLTKHDNFLELDFNYWGKIKTSCNRCMAKIPVQIWQEYDMIIKIVSEIPSQKQKNEDVSVSYISFKESFLDIKPFVLDFFNLSIPMVKQCSGKDFENETYCDKVVLQKINNFKTC